MGIHTKVSMYISAIAKKLIFFGLVVMCVVIALLYFFNRSFLQLWSGLPVIVGLLPFISFGLYYLKSLLVRNVKGRLAYCKYNIFFPFIFYHNKKRIKNNRINMEEMINEIKSCDVILRRYDRYLDGLIFSENSYFTHVGICDRNDKKITVWHCDGKSGVHESSLENFCKCDDVAVLRFSFKQTQQENLIRSYIAKDDALITKGGQLSEEIIFEELMNRTKPKHAPAFSAGLGGKIEDYREMVLKRARSLDKWPYDFNFDFHDFNSFSCVEYVWYCFKCLFPLHRIRVKDFEFFQMYNMPVIVPDVFVKNDFFRYIYSSVKIKKKDGTAVNKEDLIKFVGKDRNQIWFFLLSILIDDIIILYLCYLICHPEKMYIFLPH